MMCIALTVPRMEGTHQIAVMLLGARGVFKVFSQLVYVLGSLPLLDRIAGSTLCAAGLNLLLEMLQSFEHSDFATQFHKTYYLTLMQEIFAVMTGKYPESCVM